MIDRWMDGSVLLSSLEHLIIFQLIVSVLQPATLLFWFTLTALISVVFSYSRHLTADRQS